MIHQCHCWSSLAGRLIGGLALVIVVTSGAAEPDPTALLFGERERQLDKLSRAHQQEVEQIESETLAALRRLLDARTKEGNLGAVGEIKELIDQIRKTPPGVALATGGSVAAEPELFANRTPAGRQRALVKYAIGSGDDAYAATRRGLRWLQLTQNADGSWGNLRWYRPAVTGLVLLAYLGVGETPASVEFGDSFSAALDYLRRCLQEGSGIIRRRPEYAHPIVTMALAETAALTQDRELLDQTVTAAKGIIAGQNSLGGFTYGYETGPDKETGKLRMDLSIGAWNCQAMASVAMAGGDSPELQAAMNKAAECIITRFPARNGFSYEPGADWASPSMTAAGVYTLMLLGRGDAERVAMGLDRLLERDVVCRWRRDRDLRHMLYRWYYLTAAMFHGRDLKGGVKRWRNWQRTVVKELLDNQRPDGSWASPNHEPLVADEDWDENNVEHRQDTAIYSTAMSCLILETWFRYPPLGKVKRK